MIFSSFARSGESIVAKKDGRRYTAKFRFQLVLEALRSQNPDAEVAWAYQVHPITLSKWKKEFFRERCRSIRRWEGSPGL